MDFENPIIEKEPKLPSLEEIKAKIESIVGKEKLTVRRVLEDAKGVYLYEVVAIDPDGNATEYAYARKGIYPEIQTASSVINVAYFNGARENNDAYCGWSLSDYNEETGEWIDT
jgi:hypothetical protein